MYADLHNHTTASDGLWSPSELVEFAAKKNLSAIAITDHDTTDGLEEAEKKGKEVGVEIVPGIEIGTQYKDEDIHILGYYINPRLSWFQNIFKTVREYRCSRAQKIVRNLQMIHNLDISFEEVKKEAGKKAIARPHIGRVLINKGIVKDLAEAFEKYIGTQCPAYVPRYKLKPEEGIKIIKRAGGVPVLAHPGLLNDVNIVEVIIQKGIEGLEAYHSKHTEEQARYFVELAEKHHLLVTGGSDCHGEMVDGAPIVGDVRVPYSTVIALKDIAGVR